MTESSIVLEVQPIPGGLRLIGEIDATCAGMLTGHLNPLPEGDGDVVLNLAGVDFIDSSGLRVLIDAHRRAEQVGRRVVMNSPSPSVARLFDISGLSPHLHLDHTAD
jgi:anti-sigma B factor antagonist